MRSDLMTQSQSAAMLQALISGLSSPKVGLFTNVLSPDAATVQLADLTQPVGTWYTAVAASFGSVYIGDGGRPTITCRSQQFDYVGSSAAEEITGYMVYDTESSVLTLVSVSLLDTPVNMQNSLSSVIVEPQIAIDLTEGSAE